MIVLAAAGAVYALVVLFTVALARAAARGERHAPHDAQSASWWAELDRLNGQP